MRPELWRSLASLMDALEPPEDSGLRLSGVTLDMPIELDLRRMGAEVVLLGSLPRWRWMTAFDARPARMRVEVGPEWPVPLPAVAEEAPLPIEPSAPPAAAPPTLQFAEAPAAISVRRTA